MSIIDHQEFMDKIGHLESNMPNLNNLAHEIFLHVHVHVIHLYMYSVLPVFCVHQPINRERESEKGRTERREKTINNILKRECTCFIQ